MIPLVQLTQVQAVLVLPHSSLVATTSAFPDLKFVMEGTIVLTEEMNWIVPHASLQSLIVEIISAFPIHESVTGLTTAQMEEMKVQLDVSLVKMETKSVSLIVVTQPMIVLTTQTSLDVVQYYCINHAHVTQLDSVSYYTSHILILELILL